MKVLMFGWEFPPQSSGGLGTACHGLTKALSNKGVEVLFVLPNIEHPTKLGTIKFIYAGRIKIKKLNSILMPYMTPNSYKEALNHGLFNPLYGSNLFEEVHRYSESAEEIARQEKFDIIHCHDWLTFKAGIKAKRVSNKPLIIHVHATEFDRTGGNSINQYVYALEKEGMNSADSIIAVSNFTRNRIIGSYGINPKKVQVLHNAIEFNSNISDKKCFGIKRYGKVVLFLGRITLQKGPDYFLYVAKKVLEHENNVRFIIAGKGDMEPYIIEKTAELGLTDRVLFAGFLSNGDVDRAYCMADIFVMPSVSEPFGLTALEAVRNKTPVLISKQSGVSEVLSNCLKVDFWDIDEMANKIVALLRYDALGYCLRESAYLEVKDMSWDNTAERFITIYNQAIGA